MLRRNLEAVTLPCEVLVVVDDADDSTVPAVDEVAAQAPQVRVVVNTYGRGPANAIRYGIDHAAAPVAVVTMADGCDDPFQIDELTRLVERGVVVAAASRYARTGQQVGGPWLKGTMSRLAGLSLHYLARVGTKDATNSFKAYSDPVRARRRHRERPGLRDRHRAGGQGSPCPPAGGRDPDDLARPRVRRSPTSSCARWLPRYLRWYCYAFGPKVDVAGLERDVQTGRTSR